MKSLFLKLLAVLFISTSVSAELLFQERFQYFLFNNTLHDDFNVYSSTRWEVIDDTPRTNTAEAAGSLTPFGFGGLDTAGERLIQNANGRAQLNLITLSSVTDPTPGTSLYISFLQKFGDGATDSSKILELWRGNPTTNNTVLSFGKDTNSRAPDYGLLVEKGASNAVAVSAGEANGNVNLVVLRVDYGAGGDPDTVKIYINPNQGTTEPDTPVATYSNSADFDLRFNRIGFGSFQGGSQELDEIRIATTFAEAVPGRIVVPGLIFEESFDYVTGAINGRTNTTSATTWAALNGGSSNTVTEESLVPVSIENFETAGNRFSQTSGDRAALDLSSLTTVVTPPPGTSLYVSFVQQFGDDSTSRTKLVEMWKGAAINNNTVFAFGVDTNPSAPLQYGLLVEKGDANEVAIPISNGIPDTSANLIVMRIDYGVSGASDTVRIYKNPGISEPLTADAEFANPNGFDLTFDRIGFGSFQDGSQSIDEFRISISYEDAIPTSYILNLDSEISPLSDDTIGSISATSAVGTGVGNLSLLNPQFEEVTNASFDFVAGTGDSENALFSIVNDELRVNAGLVGLENTIASVRLRGVDAGESADRVFRFSILPENQIPANVELASLAPYLNGILPQTEPRAGTGDFITEEAFPNLPDFAELIGLAVEPRSNHLIVQQRNGDLYRVENTSSATTREQVFGVNVAFNSNGGFRSFVHHPDFNLAESPHKDDAFIFYSTSASGRFFYRLSRITRQPGGEVFGNEQIMIQQHAPDTGQHFAGGLVFDENGFLIVTMGDMELTGRNIPGNIRYQDVQRMDRIFQGKVLRLDVDMQGGATSFPATRTLHGGIENGIDTDRSTPTSHAYFDSLNVSGRGYFIPSDNYFVLNPPAPGTTTNSSVTPLHGDALQECHALGVRNPWRIIRDTVDNDILWFSVGSNGTERYEEIERLIPGGNYGWPFAESIFSDTAETGRTVPPSTYAPIYLGEFETNPASPKQIDPLWSYQSINTGDRAITGGLIYRGSLFPDLQNKLIYADTASGRIWTLDYKGLSKENFVNTEILDTPLLLRHLVAGPQGEKIYMCDGSKVYLLETDNAGSPEPPALLSQTGVFTNLQTLETRPGVFRYQPGSPLWSDRSAKKRWIALPNSAGVDGEYDQLSEKITFSENGAWTYPVGTVFIKHFELPLDERDPDNPATIQRLETRFLILGEDDSYYLVTYRWRPDGSDADLLSSGESQDFSVTAPDGSTYTQTWDYPSRQDCFQCHRDGNPVLGMRTRQINHPIAYASGDVANQLLTMKSLDVFQEPSFALSQLESFIKSVSIKDETSPLEHRVRSYLDANCAFCHDGQQIGQAQFDVRLTTPLALTGIIDASPESSDLGITGAKIVKPGDPARSILFVRDGDVGNNQMPPLARNVPHGIYLEELDAWIRQLGAPLYDQYAQTSNLKGNFNEDEDGDGIVNLVEFVYGTDAQDRDSLVRPTFDLVAGNFRYSHPISGDARTDGIIVEHWDSDNLVDWFKLGDPQSQLIMESDTSAPGTDGVINVEFDPSNASRRFIRASIEISEN